MALPARNTVKTYVNDQDVRDVDMLRPWAVQHSARLEQVMTNEDVAKSTLARYRTLMRTSEQWKDPTQGRVWAPLRAAQNIPSILQLLKDMTDMKDLSPAGPMASNLACLWLSGMREDRVFSSPTPAYMGNILANVSGYRDYMCAPFAQLKQAMRSGQAQDAETFVQALQVRTPSNFEHRNH